jgi:hypothetical protein
MASTESMVTAYLADSTVAVVAVVAKSHPLVWIIDGGLPVR